MRKILFLIGLCITFRAHAQNINYKIEMENPKEHYAYVTMTIDGWKKNTIDIKMPVWAPGSYLVRDFAKNVDYVKANSGDKKLDVKKTDKSTWQISTEGVSSITIQYNVYAFELSVRTSFIDNNHAFLNGTSIFMYVPELKNKSGKLEILIPKEFKTISTSLKNNSKSSYLFSDIDELYDSPIEIGNHTEFTFTSEGCLHRVAMFGEGNFTIEKLQADMARITSECTKVWGENPNKEYLFIIHNLTVGSGGLEHAASTCLQVNRNTYSGTAYNGYLSLVAHEYFHLWNVKRLRPAGLFPYDYDKENYTDLLWFSEGFTSYYDELIVKRAGFYDEFAYLRSLNSTIANVETTPGNRVQSLVESSFDAWIKGYKPNENSNNRTISYYPKGAIAAALLDIEIINSTNGKFKLDDLLKKLYQDFYKTKKQGFTINDVKIYAEKICNKKLDTYFETVINSPNEIDYNSYFKKAGIILNIYPRSNDPWLGIATKDQNGKLIITSIYDNSCAQKGGLNVNDEIIAINKQRVDGITLPKMISTIAIGTQAEFLVARDNLLHTVYVKLDKTYLKDYQLIQNQDADQDAKFIMNKWLNQ